MMPAAQVQEKKVGLAYWAERVLQECDKASESFAADPVHDLRVAIRRCRSMADGFLSVDPDPAWKQMKRLAKPLFRSLGELRDTQVMMEWVTKLSVVDDPVGQSMLTALAGKETEQKLAAKEALAAFDRQHWASLNAHLAKRTGKIPLEGPVFQHLALERWMEAHDLHRRALRNRSSVGYHQLRIGIKRFRYTLENFLPQRHEKWAKDLRDLQDALGEVHDLDVLRGIVRSHLEIDATERTRWQHRIAEERQKRLELYRRKMVGPRSLWRIWRADLPTGKALEDSAMAKLRTWASFLDPDVAHSRRVTEFALRLYDGLSQCGILKLQPECRRLLEAAAILHEVGRSKQGENGDHSGHQKRGQRMLLKQKPPIGWTQDEMRALAAAVRYHRGKLPVASNSSFVGLSAKRRSELLPVIGVLRLANAFDDLHDGSISQIAVERRDGVVTVYGKGFRQISPSADRIARARYLLEAACQRPIMIRPMAAATMSQSRKPRSPRARISNLPNEVRRQD